MEFTVIVLFEAGRKIYVCLCMIIFIGALNDNRFENIRNVKMPGIILS